LGAKVEESLNSHLPLLKWKSSSHNASPHQPSISAQRDCSNQPPTTSQMNNSEQPNASSEEV